jgi:hypothetical protein
LGKKFPVFKNSSSKDPDTVTCPEPFEHSFHQISLKPKLASSPIYTYVVQVTSSLRDFRIKFCKENGKESENISGAVTDTV